MDLDLAGHVAVVTGGASGIGAAVVRLLAEEEVCIAVWDLRPENVPGSSIALEADVANLASVERAWQETERQLGPVDLLIHAAAIGSGHFGYPWTQVPVHAWDRVLSVNVMGMVHVAQVAGPAMRTRQRGAMVFLSSIAGQIGSQTDPPYSASKAANINFAQCLAKDLAPCGVRVNTVCPGMVRTSLNESVWRAWNEQQPAEQRKTYDDWATEKIQRVIPLGRWQHPEDIAAMIVFLCSPRAGEVTGQTINVDGGCVMHS